MCVINSNIFIATTIINSIIIQFKCKNNLKNENFTNFQKTIFELDEIKKKLIKLESKLNQTNDYACLAPYMISRFIFV